MSAYHKSVNKIQVDKRDAGNKITQEKTRRLNPAQFLAAPETLRIDDVVEAQQEYGNQAVQRALDGKEPRKKVTDHQGNLSEDLSTTIQQSRGSGSTLPKNLQKEIGQKLGHDFSNVRLHTDDKADKLSRTINARAFTIGSDIYFKNGVFAPTTQKGRETLIHELTHVVQQSNSKFSGGRLKLGSPASAMEKEADQKGKQGSQSVIGATSPSVQRAEDEEELQMQGEEEELQMQEEEELQMQGEEEELQMQGEEEEIHMQGEEEELQMQGEEEELQMQGEEEELQMQGEEEELQMQGEEEEIQMQPDAGGVVQRDFKDWFKKKKGKIPDAPEFKPSKKPIKTRGKPLTEKGQKVLDKIKATKPSDKTLQEQIAYKAEQMGSSNQSTAGAKSTLASSTKKIEDEQRHRFKRDVAKGVDTKKMVQVSQKESLIRTLKNPESTKDQRDEAESQLRQFHKSGKFSRNPATIALKERRKMLKEKAKSGDKKAIAAYRSEKQPSFLSKAKAFYGKHEETFGKIGSAIGSFAGKAFGFGGSDKAEEKGAGGGGGGDGGGYAVIISQLMQENKLLKEQLGKK